MTIFDKAVAFVLAEEGGYVDHPDDPGGETNFGISKRSFPDLDIKALSRVEAIEIYRNNYWLACQCGVFPASIGFVLFDAAVNHGPKNAVKLLQRALNVEDDGIIGPQTIGAAARTQAHKLLPELVARRALFYASNPNVKTFGLGWFRRLSKCHQLAIGG